MPLVLTGWCSQNNEQSSSPKTPVRIVAIQLNADLAGGNAQQFGGKMAGSISLQNVTPEVAAMFANGSEVDISITPRPVV